jgi:hypothetical protein
VGERFLEAGRVYEAAEFFRKASYRQGWARLRSLAVEQGDSTLLEMALKGDPVGDPRPLWLAPRKAGSGTRQVFPRRTGLPQGRG